MPSFLCTPCPAAMNQERSAIMDFTTPVKATGMESLSLSVIIRDKESAPVSRLDVSFLVSV